jgi:hypothetical protein
LRQSLVYIKGKPLKFRPSTMKRSIARPANPVSPAHQQKVKHEGTMSLDEVFDCCGGIHLQAHDRALYAIVTTLTKVPAEVVRALADRCYIIVPSMQEKGSFTDQSVIGERHVIAFPEALFDLPVDEVEKTVLHEVAHFWLGHKPYSGSAGHSMEDLDRQEKDADQQAMQWLS